MYIYIYISSIDFCTSETTEKNKVSSANNFTSEDNPSGRLFM